MKTSHRQTSPCGEEKSIYSQEDSHVRRFQSQGCERERKMTATSGRRCYERYGKYSRVGSLAKMLLDSSRWFSPARRLKWEAQVIYSKRITYTERSRDSQSMKSARVLNVRDMKSSRLLFRLVPLERPTGETGYGLLQDLLPTPTSIDGGQGRINKSLSPNAKERPTIALMAKRGLLPTPKAQEARGNVHVDCGKRNLTDEASKMITNCPPTDGGTSQLNPLFVAEMMSFPLDWLVSPFLNGEQKP